MDINKIYQEIQELHTKLCTAIRQESVYWYGRMSDYQSKYSFSSDYDKSFKHGYSFKAEACARTAGKLSAIPCPLTPEEIISFVSSVKNELKYLPRTGEQIKRITEKMEKIASQPLASQIIKNIDYALYLVTDRGLSKGRATLEIVQAAVRGGVTCVQLREKNCTTREFIEQALSVKDFLKQHHIPLIINDRVDVALAVQADGVHLGQKDMPCKMARDILKDSMIIGISAETLEHAVKAEKDGADYIGAGPMFFTETKTDLAPILGPEGLREIRKAVKIPVVAIGGIKKENAKDIIRNGADGIAVVSAIVSADDVEQAAKELLLVIRH